MLANVAKTCSHKLNISWNIEIDYPFYFKAYFQVLHTFHASYISAFNFNFNEGVLLKNASLQLLKKFRHFLLQSKLNMRRANCLIQSLQLFISLVIYYQNIKHAVQSEETVNL